LRQRTEDLPTLVGHFARQVSAQNGWKPVPFADAAIDASSSTPGPATSANCATSLSGSCCSLAPWSTPGPLNSPCRRSLQRPAAVSVADSAGPLAERMLNFERAEVLKELERHNRNITQTARTLGLERSHFYKKCQQLGIDLKNLD